MNHHEKLALKDSIAALYNPSELKSLCFDLNISYWEITGEGHSSKVQSLVEYCRRRQMIPELVTLVNKQRPYKSAVGVHVVESRAARSSPNGVDDLRRLASAGAMDRVTPETFQAINELNDTLAMVDVGYKTVDLVTFVTKIANLVEGNIYGVFDAKVSEIEQEITQRFVRDNRNNSSLSQPLKERDGNEAAKKSLVQLQEAREAVKESWGDCHMADFVFAYGVFARKSVGASESVYTEKEVNVIPAFYPVALESIQQFLEEFSKLLGSDDYLKLVELLGSGQGVDWYTEHAVPKVEELVQAIRDMLASYKTENRQSPFADIF